MSEGGADINEIGFEKLNANDRKMVSDSMPDGQATGEYGFSFLDAAVESTAALKKDLIRAATRQKKELGAANSPTKPGSVSKEAEQMTERAASGNRKTQKPESRTHTESTTEKRRNKRDTSLEAYLEAGLEHPPMHSADFTKRNMELATHTDRFRDDPP